MSELGQIFRAVREESQERKASNHIRSIMILDEENVVYKKLSPDHYRVGDWDFWPSTGLFKHLLNGQKGRGVFNLLRKVKNVAN